MSISSAMQFWDECQLRILVLGSLFFHLFLSFSHLARQFHRLRKLLRALVWIAYLGKDALAIYALATLFNRDHQKLATTLDGGSRNSALELVWAPVLLIHLGGGRNAITAYSIEDNDLWRRHAMTMVSQVTVALYIFFRWWYSSETRLLTAAALLFVAGILECISRTWALRKASFNTMLASTAVPPVPLPLPREEACIIAACWRWCISSWRWCNSSDIMRGFMSRGRTERKILSLEDYVQEAKQRVKCAESNRQEEEEELDRSVIIDTIKKFVDLPAPYSDRLFVLKSFMKLDGPRSHGATRSLLDDMFLRLYTRRKSGDTPVGAFFIGLHIALVLASLVLFATSSKDGYNETDVLVTYVLLCCTALEFFVPLILNNLLLASPFRNRVANPTWPDMVSQCNLLAFCAREMQPTIETLLSKKICVSLVPGALAITSELVHTHLTLGWKDPPTHDGASFGIHDAASYRRFNNLRGQLTLQKHGQLERMGWSLDMPFDRSVLVWHIATTICCSMSPREVDRPWRHGKVISDYMLYLLLIRPDMLLPGTRQDLFMTTSNEVQRILMGITGEPFLLDEKKIAQELFKAVDKTTVTATATATATAAHSMTTTATVTATTTSNPTALGIIIPDACRLAKALMKKLDSETKWQQVVQGVWVEMLCYSAARCRGYLHAKSLAEGCEYLSIVWLLWSHMGMETLAEMTQKQEPVPIKDQEDE